MIVRSCGGNGETAPFVAPISPRNLPTLADAALFATGEHCFVDDGLFTRA